MRLLLMSVLMFFYVNGKTQVTHEILTGGGGSSGVTPYYSPQFLSIEQGDTVRWINLQGTHNVDGSLTTYPGNPEGFYSGEPSQGWVFEHVFNIAGTYGFECSQGDHSQTQFGILMVVEPNSISDINLVELIVYPNPSQGTFQVSSALKIESLAIYNAIGELVISANYSIPQKEYLFDLSAYSSGLYHMILKTENQTLSKKLILE